MILKMSSRTKFIDYFHSANKATWREEKDPKQRTSGEQAELYKFSERHDHGQPQAQEIQQYNFSPGQAIALP